MGPTSIEQNFNIYIEIVCILLPVIVFWQQLLEAVAETGLIVE
jgi:hypothetical protein